MTKAEQALEYIVSNVAAGKTVYICTAYTATRINQKVIDKFKRANYDLFKFDREGNLCIAAGKKYNIICCKNICSLTIKAY